jgi:hypothetical protein
MKIAIIGPPGSGKTTLGYGLYYFLKKMGRRVEFVPELIKYKVYKKMDLKKTGVDIANNIEQREFEETFSAVSPKLDFIICEAPLCNSYFYASFYNKREADVLRLVALETINDYDIVLKLSLNTNKDNYETHGRVESFEQSLTLNNHIFKEFDTLGFKNKIINVADRDDVLNIISELIKIESEG